MFIIGVFFYSIYNLTIIHKAQNHRYDQIIKVEKLKEYNNSFSWIVLDILTDYEKKHVVENRLKKADSLFKSLVYQKNRITENAETKEEKENLELIFYYFEDIEDLIKYDLYNIVAKEKIDVFDKFSKKFDDKSFLIKNLLSEEIDYLQKRLNETENKRDEFIDTIKIELVILLLLAFILSIIISSKIINDIKDKLEKLNKGVLQLFKTDDNSIKVDIGQNNELSEITSSLNAYLEIQDDMIYSREELLRNISHELKTPIAKGKFLLENIKKSSNLDQIDDINSVFIDIEELTSKLLQREKLNFAKVDSSRFKISSLILESLFKLSIDDESKIKLEIQDDFYINGDKYYLNIALKNLIDNAMKYATKFPIKIESKNNQIFIKNISAKLSNDLIYYTQPFTREPTQQIGHGLGLNIVDKIINMHNFKLNYKYESSYNIFSINFSQQ